MRLPASVLQVKSYISEKISLPSVVPKPGTHQADDRPSASVYGASLFGVFHSSALFGLTSVVVCPI